MKNRSFSMNQQVHMPWRLLGVLLLVVVFVMLASSSCTQIPATHVGVGENQFTGEYFTLEPGLHVWPFDTRIVPFAVTVTKYDLRRQIIEIGAEPAKLNGVQTDSNSPGRPIVFFFARGWAYPNRETIVELHRKYGRTYLDLWVERVWISSLKAIQGEKGYDYVGNYRVNMENEVEKALQLQLVGDDDKPLVFVSQLAIVDFDYDDNVSGYLNEVAKTEFQRQSAEQQVIINRKLQEAATVKAETDYITVKRQAEAEAIARQTMADSEAYATRVKAEAEAYSIRVVREELSKAPPEALSYFQIQRWDGKLPMYNLGATTPLLQLPQTSTTTGQ